MIHEYLPLLILIGAAALCCVWLVLKYRHIETRLSVLETRLLDLPTQVAAINAEIKGVHTIVGQMQTQLNTLTQLHMRRDGNG